MPKLRPLKAQHLIKILNRLNFVSIRQKGSHVFMRHSDGRTTVVPVHAGEEIDRGLLNKIIKKDLGISIEEFITYM